MSGFGWKTMRHWVDRNAMLRAMGLEQRSPTGDFLTGLGLFSVGVLVGAGLGLMFAPSAGGEMRHKMGERWRSRRASGQEHDRDLGEGGLPPMSSGAATGATTMGAPAH